MTSFFEIGQELMPLIYPPETREARVDHYRQVLEYMSLSKIFAGTTPSWNYRFQLDLTHRQTPTGEEAIDDESQLTALESSYRDIYVPCDALVRIERMEAMDPFFGGLLDDNYDPVLIHEVISIEPLPHVLAKWTKYIPLVLFFPTKIFLYPVDEMKLRTSLVDFFLDVHGSQIARDADHQSRYYKQYRKTTSSPKEQADTSYAADLYNTFRNGGCSLILRGGTPLGQVLAHDALKYNLNIGLYSKIRGLNESEVDAFFTYRQRLPFEHADKHGWLCGHPMSALVASYNQMTDQGDVAALRTTAKTLTQASAVDFMEVFYEGKKYGNYVLGGDADTVDYDHDPNVIFLRAKQKQDDLVRYPELAQIEPFEYLGGCTIYNPEKINLYFECPPEIKIGSIDYFEGTNPAGTLAASNEETIDLFAKSLTEIGQQVEIKIRYETISGPILKRLWVHIFEPRFVEARFHEVHSGEIEDLSTNAYPLSYHQDFEFISSFRGDGRKVSDILRYMNLKGPGEITNTFSRYGNIFIVNRNSTDYQPSITGYPSGETPSRVPTIITVVDGEETLVADFDFTYILELNTGMDYSILKINRVMTDPLHWYSAIPVKFSEDFLTLVNCYDQQVPLNIYFTWDLSYSPLLEVDLGGIAPFTAIPPLWRETKSRAVLLAAPQEGSSAEFLSLILFHEICHKMALYYGTRLWESLYFLFDAEVAHFVHPHIYHLYEGLDMSVESENYTFDGEKFFLREQDLVFLFNAPRGYESSRHQMFPGNIMNPVHNELNLGDDPDAYKPIISYRLTYKQALMLNEWLRDA